MEFDELTISLLVSGPTPNSDALQDAHLAHLASLHDAGSLLAAGPLSDPAGELRGLSVLGVPGDEARRLIRSVIFDIQPKLGAVPLDPTWSAMQIEPRGIITREPVITPADLEGVPTRIWESNVAIATWEGLGADTTVIPRGEFYIALSQGLASAGPETIGVAHAQRSVEVLKYWTRIDEYHQILNTWINAARYAELTDEQKGWLTAAAEAAGKEYTDFTAASYADTRALVREEFDVTVIEPAPQPWIEVGSAVLDKLVADGELTPEIVEYARSLQQ